MNPSTKIGQLRILAILEGISYLLFGLTMPMKYMYDMPMANRVVGMIHGILFVLFCVWVGLCALKYKWGNKITIIALVASLFPFATFILDAKILKHIEDKERYN